MKVIRVIVKIMVVMGVVVGRREVMAAMVPTTCTRVARRQVPREVWHIRVVILPAAEATALPPVPTQDQATDLAAERAPTTTVAAAAATPPPTAAALAAAALVATWMRQPQQHKKLNF